MKKIILLMFLCLGTSSIAEQNQTKKVFNSLVTIYKSGQSEGMVAVVTQADYKAELYTCYNSIADKPTELEILEYFHENCHPKLNSNKHYGYSKTVLKNRLGKKVNLVISGGGAHYHPLTGELSTDSFTYSLNISSNGSVLKGFGTVELVGSRIINTELDVPVISTYRISYSQIGIAKATLDEID